MFDWPRDMLEGETPDSPYWREQEDKFWTEETGRKITPKTSITRVWYRLYA